MKCIKTTNGWTATEIQDDQEVEVELTEDQLTELENFYDEQMSDKDVYSLISFDVYIVNGFNPFDYKQGINVCNYRPSPTEQLQHRF